MAIADGSVLYAADLNLMPRSFATVAARDAFYTANPTLKVAGIVAVIGSGVDYAEWVWTGAAWRLRGPRTMGKASAGVILVTSTSPASQLAISPTMVAGPAVITCTGNVGNDDSGATRTAALALYRDGVQIGSLERYTLPHVAGYTMGQGFAFTVDVAETTGPHTYALYGLGSAASSVVLQNVRLAVTQGDLGLA